MAGGLFGPAEVGYDGQQLGAGIGEVEPGQHLGGVAHLGDGLGADEAAKVEGIKAHFE